MTSTLQIKIDKDLCKAATDIFTDIGIDINSAIRLFLRQTVIRQTFPFTVISSDPFYHPANQAFIDRAVKDYANGAKHYHEHELIDEDTGIEKNKPTIKKGL